MHSKSRSGLQAKTKRHSLPERNEILARFEAAMARGLQAKEAISGTGTSLASVYRWRRDSNVAYGTRSAPPTFAQEQGIDAAIARLCNMEDKDRSSFLEAFFKLISWMRWPSKPKDHPSAMSVCVVSYLSQKEPVPNIEDMSPGNQRLLFRHIRLDVLSRMMSENYFELPLFREFKIDRQPFTELDYIAHVAWFLLAYEPLTSDFRDAVSLNKAYYALQNKVFKYRWPISHRTFRNVWIQRGASAPFHYIERFHSGFDLALDPSSPDFASSVDEIIEQQAELRLFLARCRLAVETLRARLDQRSLQKIRMPQFPDTLPPEPITHPPLPILTGDVMKGFAMGYKRL